jgi:hypothetical protein
MLNDMNEILQALETLLAKNCLTSSEALDKAYLAGHRAAVKQLEPTQLSLIQGIGGGCGGGGYVTSTTGKPQVK